MRKTEKWNRLDIVGFRPEIIRLMAVGSVELSAALFICA